MPYEAGISSNLSGRPKGTTNKTRSAARVTTAADLAGATADKLVA